MIATGSFAASEPSLLVSRDIFSHLTDTIDRKPRNRPLDWSAEIRCSERPSEAAKALGRTINAITAEMDYGALLLDLPQSDFEVAKTDVQYLVSSAYHVSAFAGLHPWDAEQTVGVALSRLGRLSCERQPSSGVLSYEDMILTNPVQSDPRVYCLGAAGVEERDFCLGHQLIEAELQSAIEALVELRDVADADAGQCFSRCLERLQSANYVLTRFDQHMSAGPV